MTTATTTDPKTEQFIRELRHAVEDVATAVSAYAADREPVPPAVHALARRLANLVSAIPTSDDDD